MKIAGISKFRARTRDVEIGEDERGQPVTVTLRAPRLGAIDALRNRVKKPKPPPKIGADGKTVTARHPTTGEVLKNARGQPLLELDEDDPGYLADIERWQRAQTLVILLECLDEQMQPESKREDFNSDLDFYDAVWSELEDTGLSAEAAAAMVNAATELCGITRAEIQQAQRSLGSNPGG